MNIAKLILAFLLIPVFSSLSAEGLEKVHEQYMGEIRLMRADPKKPVTAEVILKLNHRWLEIFKEALVSADEEDSFRGRILSETAVLAHSLQMHEDALAFSELAVAEMGDSGGGALMAMNAPMIAYEYFLIDPDSMPAEKVLEKFADNLKLQDGNPASGQVLEFIQKYARLARKTENLELALQVYDEGLEYLKRRTETHPDEFNYDRYHSFSKEWFMTSAVAVSIAGEFEYQERLEALFDLEGRKLPFASHLMEVAATNFGRGADEFRAFLLEQGKNFDLSGEGDHLINFELGRMAHSRSNYKEAVERLSKVTEWDGFKIAVDDRSTKNLVQETLYALGDSLVRLGKAEEGRQILRYFASQFPDDKRVNKKNLR